MKGALLRVLSSLGLIALMSGLGKIPGAFTTASWLTGQSSKLQKKQALPPFLFPPKLVLSP